MIAKEQRLVVVCRTMPPLVVGSAVLMRNLFQPYRGKLDAIAGWEHGVKIDPDYPPICPTHVLRFWPSILQRLMQHRLQNFYYWIAKWFVYRKLKRLRSTAVFSACTPDGIFFVASFLACRRLGIPFLGHMHDLWLENTRQGSFLQKLAQKWEPVIFREADKIFCMTDTQRDYYKDKYGGNYEIIPHCVPPDVDIPRNPSVRTKSSDEVIQILYTGNFSSAMNVDALRGLVACLDFLPENYRVMMLANASVETRQAERLCHPRIDWDWMSVAAARKLMREADILFLPLSFKNCSPEEVRTVFATKTLDYLTSGVPILVYSPATCHHSRSAKSHGWGCVVDDDNPQVLAQAIQDLAGDRSRRESLVMGAVEEAKRRNPVFWARYIEDLVQQRRGNSSS
ncbi:MAG: glycosyltransferase [Planctomycetota bacterium]